MLVPNDSYKFNDEIYKKYKKNTKTPTQKHRQLMQIQKLVLGPKFGNHGC